MKNDALLYRYKEGTDKIIPENISNFSATINKYDKLYLTVDMDVLSSPAAGSLSSGDPKSTPKRTNWQDGDVTISTLDEWLRLVPGNKIAAADITGFPPMKMLNGDLVTDSPATNAIADIYIRDIETVARLICTLMGI